MSTQRARTRTRLGRRRIRARKIIIILTGRAGAAIFLASKNRNTYLSFLPINSAAAFEDRASKSLIPEIQKSDFLFSLSEKLGMLLFQSNIN